MTTNKQITANQANSQLSTGAKTASGKLAVSANAIRHGLLSSKLFLANESAADYENLLAGLVESFKPVGHLENLLTEKIAVSFWRQRRLVGAEAAAITYESMQAVATIQEKIKDVDNPLNYFESQLTASEKVQKKALLNELGQVAQVRNSAPIGSDLLIRYSTGLDNELFKAIAALRAEQEFRFKNATD